jgi:methyl-accepting chemotaxis protein
MKRLLMNLKLSKKILIAPVVVIVFLVISGVVSYLSLSNQKLAVEEIFGTRFKSFQTSARLIKDVTSVHANLYKVISWATANYDVKKIDALGKEQIKTAEGAMATVGKVLQDKKLTPEVANAYKTVMTALTAYQKDAVAALDLAGHDVHGNGR